MSKEAAEMKSRQNSISKSEKTVHSQSGQTPGLKELMAAEAANKKARQLGPHQDSDQIDQDDSAAMAQQYQRSLDDRARGGDDDEDDDADEDEEELRDRRNEPLVFKKPPKQPQYYDEEEFEVVICIISPHRVKFLTDLFVGRDQVLGS